MKIKRPTGGPVSEPPIVDFSDAPSDPPVASEAPEAPRRRGRPRSPQTIERDERVLKALHASGQLTKEQLVSELQLEPNMVYLSLWRLRRAGRVVRESTTSERHVWRLV